MMRNPHSVGEGVPRWILVLGVATIALCFGVAYHWGSTAESDAAEEPMHESLQRIKLVVKESKECELRRDGLFRAASRMKGGNQTKFADLQRAQQEYDSMVRQEEAGHSNVSACEEDVRRIQIEAEHMDATSHDRVLRLQGLQEQLADLMADIKLIKSDKGMRRSLLLDSLHQAREKHLHLMDQLGTPAVMDEMYDDEILQQYKPRSVNVTAASVARLANRDNANLTIADFIARWSNFSFNQSVHTRVFLPQRAGPEGTEPVERPQYFGVVGTAPESVGTILGNISAPVTTTAFAIKSLTTVALCAMRHNNSNLTFPNRFRRVDSLHRTELLNRTVETPLVTYCRQCVNAVAQPVFRLACGREKPNRLYGTYDFWAARSMIRPTPEVVESARKIWSNFSFAGRSVLAVAFKNSPQLRLKCKYQRKPQRHYMWARALSDRTNAKLFEAVPGANITEQCQPGIPTLFAAIDALRTQYKFDSVLISVETQQQKEQIQNTEFGNGMQVVAIRPDSGYDDMTELLLASWAQRILVNRYSDHSQVLTEMFALRNNVEADKVHFF